jgi:polyhydroxyalkanoate synthesis repressor PhaR
VSSAEEILIKKYDNRRLYCVNEAHYVSLADIRAMIVAGGAVRVVEKSTGKDITRLILAQILLEERYELLPDFFLRLLIQAPEGFLQKFFSEFMPPMLDWYMKMLANPGQVYSNPFPQPFMNFSANPFQNLQGMPQAFASQFPLNLFNQPRENTPRGETSADEQMRQMLEILKRLADLEKKIK